MKTEQKQTVPLLQEGDHVARARAKFKSSAVTDSGLMVSGPDGESVMKAVRCVNSHDQLVSALEKIDNKTRMMPGNPHWEVMAQDIQNLARAALASAKG